jgi:hypothetical protein
MSDKNKVKAKPPVTTTRGYRLDGVNDNVHVKIATSNLFIDTGSVPVDYMTGAVFDGIGGNEFINGGSSEIILQEGNSLISNANDIQYDINTKTNEKQADGTDTFFSQFDISLNSYLPLTNASEDELVGLAAPRSLDNPDINIYVDLQNVYFDPENQNICIELTNLSEGEQVEVEFITSYTSLDSGII